MKVLVCGDREWKNWKVIRERLERLPENSLIIIGGARGADSIAERIVIGLGKLELL